MIRALLLSILGVICLCFGAFILLKNEGEASAKLPEFSLIASVDIAGLSSNIVLSDGFLWAITKDSELLKLSPSGEILERKDIGLKKLSTSFLVENNVLYAVSANRKIFAYDLERNAELWSFDCPKKVLADLVLSGDLLIFGAYDFKLYALDKFSGNMQLNYEASEAIHEKVVVDASTLYFGDCSGILTAFNLDSKQAKTQGLSQHLPTAPIIAGEFLLLLDYENTLFCLDKNSLDLIWEMPTNLKSLCVVGDKVFGLGNNLFAIDFDNQDITETLALREVPLAVENLGGGRCAIISEACTFYVYDMEKSVQIFHYNFGVDLLDIKAYSDKIFIMADSKIYIFKRNEQSN